ncbi:MAG: hypothetical protein ACXWTW_08495 [Methylobacter sp.]
MACIESRNSRVTSGQVCQINSIDETAFISIATGVLFRIMYGQENSSVEAVKP